MSAAKMSESDKAKKIYRAVCDIIKRLDNIHERKTGFRDIFLPEVIFLRDRLREYCEKLMFSWPLEYGRKAEEVIWRKAFYDVIQLVKANIKEVKMDASIDNAFKTHLSSAIGFYTGLLLTIQSKFELNLSNIVDFPYITMSNPVEAKLSDRPMKPETKAAIKTWATLTSFRTLVYLGDIARYMHDYKGSSKRMSLRYYHQALMVCPGLGIPFNQLGTLVGMSAYGFRAAYYYIRCLISSTPFHGTHNNLMKLFERNRLKLLELDGADDDHLRRLPHNFHHRHPRKNLLSYAKSKDNKRFIMRFIRLIELFFTSPKECDKTHVYELCQVVLDDFDRCLKSNFVSRNASPVKRDRVQSSEERQNVVDDEIIFYVFVTCLASIHHLSKKGHDLVAASIAFSLAMFSHSLNSTLIRLRPHDLEVNINDLESEDPCSNLRPTHSRKYTSLRMVDSGCSKIVEENIIDVKGGDDDGDAGGDHGDDIKIKQNDDDDASGEDAQLTKESSVKAKKTKKKKAALTLRKRRRGSDDDDEDDDEDNADDHSDDDGDDYDEDNPSSEVESEGALSDFDLISSSDEGSGMESQPEDEERKQKGEESVRAPAYHKVISPQTNQSIPNNKVVLEEDRSEISKTPETIEECSFDDDQDRNDDSKDGIVESSINPPPGINPSPIEPNMDEVSGTWMSDAAVFLGSTLKMSYFTDEGGFRSSDVFSGNRDVPVPPGFERSQECQHVMEITEKLANFNIETDTDVNQSDGDETIGDQSDMEAEMERKRQDTQRKEISRIMNIVTSESMLEYVKIFVEWMIINPLIVTSCAKISSSVWFRLTSLLNLLPKERDVFQSDHCTKNKNFSKILAKELKNETEPDGRYFSITEDVHLLEFPPLKAAQHKIDFEREESINDKQEAIIRLCRTRALCRSLSTLEGIDFNYLRDSDSFQGPTIVPSVNRIKANDREELTKTSMMKSLAQLRVKSQTGRDRSIREIAPHGFPVYLVPDTESIYEGLKLMKKLTQQDKLKVVVPNVVLSFLDSIKTVNRTTMKAVEWVEEEVYRNDLSQMRLQKPHETCLPSSDVSNSKDDYILRIVDCCLYLSGHHASSVNKDQPIATPGVNSVCLLTWMTPGNSELSGQAKSALENAAKKGIKIKTVGEFFHQWQQLSSTIP